MNEMLGWIKKHRIKIALIVFSLFFLPLIIVHLLFKWNSECYFMSAEWSAGDVIGYIAGFEAFLGTTFLGFVAYKQNENHNRIQINSEAANTSTPFLVIECVVAINNGGNGVARFETSHYTVKCKEAVVIMKNIGQGLAVNVSYKHWIGKIHSPEDNQIKVNLDINTSFEIRIQLNEKNLNEIVSKEIEYQNIIGFRYKQTLTYKLVCETKQITEEDFEEEYFLHVYLLGKQQRIGFDEEITNY